MIDDYYERVNQYLDLLNRFKKTSAYQEFAEIINRLKGESLEMKRMILSRFSQDDLEIMKCMCSIEALTKLVLLNGDQEQIELAQRINIEDTVRMYLIIRRAIAENRLLQVERQCGADIFNGMTINSSLADYLNELKPRNIDDEDYGGEGGAFTFRMDAPKVLRIYQTLTERLGRALTEALSFQAREYQMALERIREARYYEMEEYDNGYGPVRRPGGGR